MDDQGIVLGHMLPGEYLLIVNDDGAWSLGFVTPPPMIYSPNDGVRYITAGCAMVILWPLIILTSPIWGMCWLVGWIKSKLSRLSK